MMLAVTLRFLALCIALIQARALPAIDGISVVDTSPTAPSEQLVSQVSISPVIEGSEVQVSTSSSNGTTTSMPDGTLPATSPGNSSSVLNPNNLGGPDPKHYPVPGTPVTVMLSRVGQPLPPKDADAALEAVLDRLHLEIRTSGDQWMPRVYRFTQDGIDIEGLHPFRNQATLLDLQYGITGVQDLMELSPAEGGIGFVAADFSFARDGRGVVGRIQIKPKLSNAAATATVETS